MENLVDQTGTFREMSLEWVELAYDEADAWLYFVGPGEPDPEAADLTAEVWMFGS